MKRKRGHKKGKAKGTANHVISVNETLRNEGGQNNEETSGLDEFDNDKDNSGMEVDTPSSTGTDQHYNLANINPDGSIDKAVGKSVGRVKVKLRTPKMLDSQPTSSDAPTQSDTDKSSQQHGLEKQGVNAERVEDSANSLPNMKLGTPSKRAGSIKIKASKILGSNADQASKPLSTPSEITHPKERNPPQQHPRYNKQELDASLVVIRKVMKMDAAEPFNVPVNPEALGIPDYFDIIDTPMDFGTICSNLEKNDKYMNSEDVFKDVQYIWDNCYKYNNKGDYILDLMRRVKKNFMKYWTAAGLYSEQPKGTKGTERTTAEDNALSGDGKVGKGGQLKQKTKKRHGRHHKHDCLCAICVLKRRRKEREENARIAKGSFGGDKHAREFKQEESMLVESPGGEDSSSNIDESVDTDGDVDEDKGEVVKMEISEKECSPSERKHEGIDVDNDGDDDDQGLEEGEEEEEDGEEDEEESEINNQKRETDDTLKHGGTLAEKSNVGDTTVHDEYKTNQEGQAAVVHQQKQHEGSQDKTQKAKLLESLYCENPKLSSLCGILFPQNSQSVWSGPHSLIQRRNSARTSSIHAAIRTFMD
ncbi:bromodomain testis-specific protein [Abrus precatorius]|uniref:Bromodomain testis-specific protein n=1 Tax=Abrus precatorius TaxID=3816 RepID=A0A8B8LWE4_ABRPR|nr:bromodomain testis-specific protein [Abrus precatorius]XP_027360706.1 bromodomain testis-specific protein [Abrus precatorius]XP_027360715.1 bromodomain testis-specific protein [Abrus precatorius]